MTENLTTKTGLTELRGIAHKPIPSGSYQTHATVALADLRAAFDELDRLQAEVAELRLALRQIINGCVDLDDGYNELFRLWPEEIRKLAKAALGEQP